MFDTHCHLDEFGSDLNNVLFRARQSRVTHFLIPSCGEFNWTTVNEIANSQEHVYYALGLHPVFMDKHDERVLRKLDQALQDRSEKCVAVGECGLDFFVSAENHQRQIELLAAQLNLANQYRLPVILHCRKAEHDLTRVLKESKVHSGGVLHAFSGSVQQAMNWVKLGLYIGVGGLITYERANKTRNTIRQIPLDYLVLETDSPDMPVCGYQGQPNQPDKIPLILDVLCDLRSEPRTHIEQALFNNSMRLFNLSE